MQLDIAEEDFYLLLHSAVSYACGRCGYIVSSTCETVKKYAYLLTESHKNTLTKNLANDLDYYRRNGMTCGDKCDHERWEQLLDFLEKR